MSQESPRPIILVVDDAPQNLALIDELLSDRYTIKVAPNAARALKIAHSQPQPDLILLDVMMPDQDGYSVCRTLKADAATRDIPIIFLTAKTQLADEQEGFVAGAVDYIAKPFSPPIVIARVATHLELKAARDQLRQRNEWLESEAARNLEDLQAIREATVFALTSLAETRDNETGNHIRRTQHYLRELAQSVCHLPRFAELTPARIELLFKSAPLHDIGKVGIPDRILLKPGRLTSDEFEIMKTHTTLGWEALNKAHQSTGREVPFLRVAAEIALSHQEKWDGSGYPRGLAGEAIPLSARLMAVADVYDALISRRVYKEPMPHEQAREILLAGTGHHFDPDLIDGFLRCEAAFVGIAQRYADDEASLDAIQARIERNLPPLG